MLYMVEMDMPLPERFAAWDAWYDEHILKLLALPGFRSAQRFQSVTPAPSPYMAVYSLASADVLDSPEYRAKAGPASTGEWRTVMTNWRRNMMSGLDEAPAVEAGRQLVIVDRLNASAGPLPAGFSSLTPVGLDRSVVERGLRVCAPTEQAPAGDSNTHVRVFRPLRPRISSKRP